VAGIEVLAGIGAMIVRVAADQGVDPAKLAALAGFDPTLADDPDQRISLETETALWDHAARLTGDAAFGVHAAQRIQPGIFDVLDYAIRTAPTLRVSLERLVRYNRLVHDAAVFRLVDEGDLVRIEHTLGPVSQSRHAAEFTMAGVVVVGGQITGVPVRPTAVEFRHPEVQAKAIAELQRVFGVRPHFSAAANAVELPRTLLERRLATADPLLFRVVDRHAEALLAARPDPAETMGVRVRRILARTLGEGEGSAKLGSLASRLHVGERSLQRRLADEGLTFDAVLDEVRHDLAVRYLSDAKIAISEVAYLLGYSEPSAFHRAFKRWTGMTPSRARGHAA
jgi:AraC-like DNA-binding protein